MTTTSDLMIALTKLAHAAGVTERFTVHTDEGFVTNDITVWIVTVTGKRGETTIPAEALATSDAETIITALGEAIGQLQEASGA